MWVRNLPLPAPRASGDVTWSQRTVSGRGGSPLGARERVGCQSAGGEVRQENQGGLGRAGGSGAAALAGVGVRRGGGHEDRPLILEGGVLDDDAVAAAGGRPAPGRGA